jgi:hypothetical protein
MTLTDIISKVTRYAKNIIVTDNSSTPAVSIVQSGTGDGVNITATSPLSGTLKIFDKSPTGGDFVYDGGTDALFTFNANGGDTRFDNTNVGIGITPTEKLDVFGIIRSRFSNIINGTAGAFKFVSCKTDDKARFDFGVDDTAESGSNAGSNFFIHNFNDSGAFISRAFHITRSTGNVGINTSTPAKTLHVNGTVRLQGIPTFATNAAAIAGGLVADDVYKIAAGELRIVV